MVKCLMYQWKLIHSECTELTFYPLLFQNKEQRITNNGSHGSYFHVSFCLNMLIISNNLGCIQYFLFVNRCSKILIFSLSIFQVCQNTLFSLCFYDFLDSIILFCFNMFEPTSKVSIFACSISFILTNRDKIWMYFFLCFKQSD